MSAGDILFSIVIWLYKNTLLLLPSEVGTLSLTAFSDYLDGLKNNLVYAFSGVAKIFPMDLALTLAGIVIAGEIIMFGIRAGNFLINLIRGSGA